MVAGQKDGARETESSDEEHLHEAAGGTWDSAVTTLLPLPLKVRGQSSQVHLTLYLYIVNKQFQIEFPIPDIGIPYGSYLPDGF